MKTTHFERAIFLSWYCSKRDCAFCYLSSKPNVKPDPSKDRRSLASIFAEAIICKACGWKIEFLSGGCDTFSDNDLFYIIKTIAEITGQKQWLNVGILNTKQLKLFKPYLAGVCGTVECITPKLRDKLCPSKPLGQIEDMFREAERFDLKKAVTMIIGLGEDIGDFKVLKEFLEKNCVDRVTFYRLKPQKGTIFENAAGPDTGYYVEWIKKTRKALPKIEIIVGSWLTHLDEIHLLLNAGAQAITKFPSIRKFNTKHAREIEEQARKSGLRFTGTLSKKPKINIDREIEKINLTPKMKKSVKEKLETYLSRMKSNY